MSHEINKTMADFMKEKWSGEIHIKDFYDEVVDTTHPDYTVCRFHAKYGWFMPVARVLINYYEIEHDLDYLIEALGTADIDEIVGAIMRAIKEINDK